MSTLQHAIALHRAGQLADAQGIYQQISAARGEGHAYATNMLGLIALQQGNAAKALDLLQESVERDPHDAELWLNLGEIQRRTGHRNEAVKSLQQAIHLAPENAHAHYNLGVALRDQLAAVENGGSENASTHQLQDEALRSFRRATELAPAMPEAWNNLGQTLLESQQPFEALAAYETLLQLRPNSPEVHTSLARALFEAGRHEAALAHFEKAIALNPQFAAGWANLGAAQRKLGQRSQAVIAYQRAADLDGTSSEIVRELALAYHDSAQPSEAQAAARRAITLSKNPLALAEAHRTLALILAAANRLPEALAEYEAALKLRPHADDWRFEWEALRGNEQIRDAPDSFVRGLFDAYAPKFEKHVTETLNYHVPRALRDLLLEAQRMANVAQDDIPRLRVLDLGCGTGLCGTLLRPFASHIIGVDLAPKMIQACRDRHNSDGQPIYNELITADITTAMHELASQNQHFDIIIAADVFIYVGALERAFPAAAALLSPNGLLAFSLERCEGSNFILTRQRRFAHSLHYIQTLAGQCQFVSLITRPGHIRNDVPEGYLCVLQRPA